MIKYSNLKQSDIEEFRDALERCEMLQDFNEQSIMSKYIEAFPDLVIVAKEKNKIVGTIIGQGAGSILGSLWTIAVLPEYRGKGIATYMIKKMSRRLVKNHGCLWIYLFVSETNPAINLYKNLGFKSDKIHSYGIWGKELSELIK